MSSEAHYKFYEYLRNRPPIKMQGAWMISTHSSIKEVLDNPEKFRSNRMDLAFQNVDMTPKLERAKKVLQQWILHQDAKNTPLKNSLAMPIYTYFKSSLETALNEKLKACFQEPGEIEFRHKVAIPVVIHLLMDILNVPKVDVEKQEANIFRHMQNIANLITVLHLDNDDANSFAHSLLFIAKLGENYDGIDDDFEESEYLEEYDLQTAQKGAIYHAFAHDTVNALCNAYYIILENKDKIENENVEAIVAEALRIEPAVHALIRTANEDVVIRDQKIKKDEMLVLHIASSNRDKDYHKQDDLDEFSPKRKFETFNFGHGLHACIGQHLAKHVVKLMVKFALEHRNDEVKRVEWDTTTRAYRNMYELVVGP